jgi:TM2 domain-containing membrane protein YozV
MQLEIDGSLAGQEVLCPGCRGQFRILPPQPLAAGPSTALAFSSTAMVEANRYSGTAVNRESHRQYIPDKKSAGAAAVLSFLYTGLGQIYNGQIVKGFMLMLLPPLIGGIIFGCGIIFGISMFGVINAVSQHEQPARPHARINGQRYFSDEIPPDVLERLSRSDREANEAAMRNYEAALRKVHAAALSEQETAEATMFAVYVGAAVALVAAWLFGIYDAYSTAEQINERERRRYR